MKEKIKYTCHEQTNKKKQNEWNLVEKETKGSGRKSRWGGENDCCVNGKLFSGAGEVSDRTRPRVVY